MKYIRLVRIKHWVKNILIFFPLVFSGSLLIKERLIKTVLGFFAFSLAASIIYIINDLKDVEADRRHAVKKKRPLASGAVSRFQGVVLLIILGAGLAGIMLLNTRGGVYVALYMFINCLYSFGMKNVPLLDVAILAADYIIRLLYGGVLAETGVSEWMLLTVMMASFFLAFGKRRGEYIEYGGETRKSVKGYSLSFLDGCVNMFLSLTIVFYSLTCMDKESGVARQDVNMFWTVPLVIFICLRYLMKVKAEGGYGGDPVEVVMHDKVLMGLIGIYGMAVLLSIYLRQYL